MKYKLHENQFELDIMDQNTWKSFSFRVSKILQFVRTVQTGEKSSFETIEIVKDSR